MESVHFILDGVITLTDKNGTSRGNQVAICDGQKVQDTSTSKMNI